jgi:NADH:ubiquinone reductase (H+-translocating)
MPQDARVVVVGGGFGGLTVAKELRRAPVQLTLVDRQNHHLFQPLLYQVAMAGLAPSEIAVPIRALLAKHDNTTVLLDEVVHVDLAQKVVQVAESEPLPYDYLVLAPGARTHYFGHDEWEAYAPGLKSIDDAVEIRRRVLLAFEAAERERNPGKRSKLLSFIVIGGGPTGVELAGSIAELGHYVLGRDFKHVRPSETRVLLLEGGPRVLASFDPELSEKTVRQLSELGVHVRTGSVVSHIGPEGVTLNSGEVLLAETVVWAAGVASSPLLAKVGLDVDRAGRAKVEPDCSIPGHPEVFVIGDAAFMLGEDGKPLPGVSPTAMQMARHVAKQITGELAGKPQRTPFKYRDKGSMATIGRSRAIAQVGKLKLSGFMAWMAWLLVHIWFLIGFRNRVLVLFDWAWSYVFYRRGARLITGGRLLSGPVSAKDAEDRSARAAAPVLTTAASPPLRAPSPAAASASASPATSAPAAPIVGAAPPAPSTSTPDWSAMSAPDETPPEMQQESSTSEHAPPPRAPGPNPRPGDGLSRSVPPPPPPRSGS